MFGYAKKFKRYVPCTIPTISNILKQLTLLGLNFRKNSTNN